MRMVRVSRNRRLTVRAAEARAVSDEWMAATKGRRRAVRPLASPKSVLDGDAESIDTLDLALRADEVLEEGPVVKPKILRKISGFVRRSSWTEEEDAILREAVKTMGARRWSKMAALSGLKRTGKQCRERWTSQIDDGLCWDPFTPEEDAMILTEVSLGAPHWGELSREMGRSYNAVRNRYALLRRQRETPQEMTQERLDTQFLQKRTRSSVAAATKELEQTTFEAMEALGSMPMSGLPMMPLRVEETLDVCVLPAELDTVLEAESFPFAYGDLGLGEVLEVEAVLAREPGLHVTTTPGRLAPPVKRKKRVTVEGEQVGCNVKLGQAFKAINKKLKL